MNTAAKPDLNHMHLVLSYYVRTPEDPSGEYTPYTILTRVYLVPAHTAFHCFGGSSRGLVTGKTASLIMRQTGPWGCRDSEWDLADPSAWGTINAGLKLAAAQGTLHHVGHIPE